MLVKVPEAAAHRVQHPRPVVVTLTQRTVAVFTLVVRLHKDLVVVLNGLKEMSDVSIIDPDYDSGSGPIDRTHLADLLISL
jgi:hypothetical protein